MIDEILDALIQQMVPPPARLFYTSNSEGKKRKIELPFVTGVFANLSGNSVDRNIPVEERQFTDIDAENFDTVLASYCPKVEIGISRDGDSETKISDTLRFTCLDDFLPENIDSKVLSLELILRDPDFLKLEATWRGLFYLVNAVRSYKLSRIRVLDISKAELRETLDANDLTPENPLVRQVYTDPFCRSGGEPFGCFVGDYYFNQQNLEDTRLLDAMGQLSALVFAPFISGASPKILGLNSFQGYTSDDSSRILWDRSDRTAWIAWQALRKSKISRFLYLAFPKILVRQSYGLSDDLRQFIPDLGPDDGVTEPCYANSAYAIAINIHRAYQAVGWPCFIRGVESGGVIERPVNCESELDSPIETSLSDREEAEFAKAGYMPLIQKVGTSLCCFLGLKSVHQPMEFDDCDRSANEDLLSRLQFVLAGCRILHYLRCLYLDGDIASKPPGEIERSLTSWLSAYVETEPESDSVEPRPATNLFDASSLSVKKHENQPDFFHLVVAIRPDYGLEGMTSLMSFETLLTSGTELPNVDLREVLSPEKAYGLVDLPKRPWWRFW